MFAVRFAVSVFSLDTLDISVKHEIYESKIFTNNVARYLRDISFSIKKKKEAIIVLVDLEYSTWIWQKILAFLKSCREVNRNNNRVKKKKSRKILLRSRFVFQRFFSQQHAERNSRENCYACHHVYLIKWYWASALIGYTVDWLWDLSRIGVELYNTRADLNIHTCVCKITCTCFAYTRAR